MSDIERYGHSPARRNSVKTTGGIVPAGSCPLLWLVVHEAYVIDGDGNGRAMPRAMASKDIEYMEVAPEIGWPDPIHTAVRSYNFKGRMCHYVEAIGETVAEAVSRAVNALEEM